MRVALINTNRANKLYPIALLKLGAWLKNEGHYCQLFENKLPQKDEFDEIWITTVFTWDLLYIKTIIARSKKLAKRVLTGGIVATLNSKIIKSFGSEVHIGLHPEAEKFAGDYSLLNRGEKIEYSITHTSRGCIRRCEFCVVPKIEPKFYTREWVQDLYPTAKRILFYDNNWLAKNVNDLKKDCEQIKKLKQDGQIKSVDFNQGMDCRILTDNKADILKGVPIDPFRFAFDGPQEDGCFQKAVLKMHERGFNKFNVYMLYNFTDTPEDFYYRLNECAKLRKTVTQMVANPMRYEPILCNSSKSEYIGKYWTKKTKNAINAIMAVYSPTGQLSFHGEQDFHYFFGHNEKEFIQLINYPKLKLLLRRRKEALRIKRRLNI